MSLMKGNMHQLFRAATLGILIYFLCHVNAMKTGQLRLVGGNTYREGRLEILHEGKWGTICNTTFGIKAAKVACKEFGFEPVNDVQYYTAGGGSGTVWLDDVVCSGGESSITRCRHSSWGSNNCSHDFDVGIRCLGITEGQVRLVGRNDDQNAGRLEIFRNGKWGTVCSDGFSLNNSLVVCRQLQKSTTNPQFYVAGGGSGPVWLGDVTCEGTEQAFWSCNHGDWGKHDCSHEKDVGVRCYSTGKPAEGDLRLADGTRYRGRLEVYHNGTWGTVCDDSFGYDDALVACRQLGVTNPNVYVYDAVGGTGPILLDDLSCNNTEQRLAECKHNGWGKANCNHGEDVGLVCLGDHKIDGSWGPWSEWSNCDQKCGTGNQTRSRMCDSPAPSFSGKDCVGSDVDTKECKLIDCPVDGNWASWSCWGSCSVTCGAGYQTRVRKCSNPPVVYGGTYCPGNSFQIQDCIDKVCPVDGNWSTWTYWGSCDVTCGKGFHIRARYCDNPKPSNGGESCHGNHMETHPCYDTPCPNISQNSRK